MTNASKKKTGGIPSENRGKENTSTSKKGRHVRSNSQLSMNSKSKRKSVGNQNTFDQQRNSFSESAP